MTAKFPFPRSEDQDARGEYFEKPLDKYGTLQYRAVEYNSHDRDLVNVSKIRGSHNVGACVTVTKGKKSRPAIVIERLALVRWVYTKDNQESMQDGWVETWRLKGQLKLNTEINHDFDDFPFPCILMEVLPLGYTFAAKPTPASTIAAAPTSQNRRAHHASASQPCTIDTAGMLFNDGMFDVPPTPRPDPQVPLAPSSSMDILQKAIKGFSDVIRPEIEEFKKEIQKSLTALHHRVDEVVRLQNLQVREDDFQRQILAPAQAVSTWQMHTLYSHVRNNGKASDPVPKEIQALKNYVMGRVSLYVPEADQGAVSPVDTSRPPSSLSSAVAHSPARPSLSRSPVPAGHHPARPRSPSPVSHPAEHTQTSAPVYQGAVSPVDTSRPPSSLSSAVAHSPARPSPSPVSHPAEHAQTSAPGCSYPNAGSKPCPLPRSHHPAQTICRNKRRCPSLDKQTLEKYKESAKMTRTHDDSMMCIGGSYEYQMAKMTYYQILAEADNNRNGCVEEKRPLYECRLLRELIRVQIPEEERTDSAKLLRPTGSNFKLLNHLLNQVDMQMSVAGKEFRMKSMWDKKEQNDAFPPRTKCKDLRKMVCELCRSTKKTVEKAKKRRLQS